MPKKMKGGLNPIAEVSALQSLPKGFVVPSTLA